MRFKKGDTVYYIAADESVKRAIISHTHPKDKEFPYELDLPVKNRFYPDDCVFATMEEANRAVKKAQQDRMSAAIRDGKELNLKQKMPDVLKRRDLNWISFVVLWMIIAQITMSHICLQLLWDAKRPKAALWSL